MSLEGSSYTDKIFFLFSVVLFVKLTHCICVTTTETSLSLVPCRIVVDMQKNLKMIRCVFLFLFVEIFLSKNHEWRCRGW